MSTSTSSTVPFSAIYDPPDVLVGGTDARTSSLSATAPENASVEPLKNVEENQQVDVGESVIRVTTLPLSIISDLQEQPSQAQIPISAPEAKFSTVFHAALENADTILKSSDDIFFKVNFAIVNDASNNAFGSTLQANVAHALVVDESSVTLSIILHAVYDWPSDQSSPVLQALLDAVDRMPHYGLSVQHFAQPATHIYALMSSMAVQHPLEIYTLAARHLLHALAVFASHYLISCDIRTLTDRTVDRMGPLYLKRLIELHFSRISALLHILGVYPVLEHEECTDAGKKAWAYGTLDISKANKPDYPAERISSTMSVYAQNIKCIRCSEIFSQAVSDAVAHWAMVPDTI